MIYSLLPLVSSFELPTRTDDIILDLGRQKLERTERRGSKIAHRTSSVFLPEEDRDHLASIRKNHDLQICPRVKRHGTAQPLK